jgi:hypothetical protein
MAIAPAAAEDVRSGLPSAANLLTVARPIPVAVPVMTMTLGIATPQGCELAPSAATALASARPGPSESPMTSHVTG